MKANILTLSLNCMVTTKTRQLEFDRRFKEKNNMFIRSRTVEKIIFYQEYKDLLVNYIFLDSFTTICFSLFL